MSTALACAWTLPQGRFRLYNEFKSSSRYRPPLQKVIETTGYARVDLRGRSSTRSRGLTAVKKFRCAHECVDQAPGIARSNFIVRYTFHRLAGGGLDRTSADRMLQWCSKFPWGLWRSDKSHLDSAYLGIVRSWEIYGCRDALC